MNGCFRSAVGIFIAVPSLLMGLLAAGLIFAEDAALQGIGVFFGGLAFVGLVIAIRRFRSPKATDLADAPGQTPFPGKKTSVKKRSKKKYEDVAWGEPPPTVRQFGFAKSLGVEFSDGMTKRHVSEAIDRALNDQQAPTKVQLDEIAAMHGVLPREISRAEADDVIEFLSGYGFRCPACREDVCCAGDDTCPLCGASLENVRIPVILSKR